MSTGLQLNLVITNKKTHTKKLKIQNTIAG